MTIQQILGIGFLMIGMISVSSYSEDLSGFRIGFFHRELAPMQQRWGRSTGTILHVLEYVIIPLGFGLFFLTGMLNF